MRTVVAVDTESPSVFVYFVDVGEGFGLHWLGNGWVWFSDSGAELRRVAAARC